MDRLRALYDTVSVLVETSGGLDSVEPGLQDKLHMEVVRICRVLKVLVEYVAHCDFEFVEDRVFPPLSR
jgi:hypothetical protein